MIKGVINTVVSEPAILVKGLYKSFGDNSVLSNVDLTIDWGTQLTIFGSNGSGKTTLLKSLALQCRVDDGSINIAGKDVYRDRSAIRQNIGVVGHQPMLYQEMTCMENLIFFGRMYGVVGIAKRAQKILSEMGLERHSNDRVRNLSHGMQKRLAICRAIIHRPPILLMDEPETGLDIRALEIVRSLIKSWTFKMGAVVITTHSIEVGLGWGSDVAILNNGAIVYRAKQEEVDQMWMRKTLLSNFGLTS